jgi:DNA-binding protein
VGNTEATEKEHKHEKTEEKATSNVVLVGKKPVMNYVVACVTFFNQGINRIELKARGVAISKVVDTVELLRRAFIKNLIIKNILVGTEIMEREGKKTNVSTLEIVIEKPPINK